MSRWPRTHDGLTWGCALAIGCVGLDLLVTFGSGHYDFDAIQSDALTQFFLVSQLVLLGIWTGFGRAPLVVRTVCLAMCLFWFFERPEYFHPYGGLGDELLKAAQLMLVVPLACFVFRLAGYEIVQSTSSDCVKSLGASRIKPIIIVQILAWGIALAWVGPAIARRSGGNESLLCQIPLAVYASGVVGIVLASDRPTRRFAFCLAAGGFFGIFYALSVRFGDRSPSTVLIGTVVGMTVPIFVLLLYRRLGFRLVRRHYSGADVPLGPAVELGQAKGPELYPTVAPVADKAVPPQSAMPSSWSPEPVPADLAVGHLGAAWLIQSQGALARIEPLAMFLLGMIVAVDAATVIFFRKHFGFHHQELLMMFLLSQNGVIGVWAALGSLRGLIRFPLVIAGIILLVAAGWQVEYDGQMSEGVFISIVGFGSMAAMTALGLLIARGIGFRLTRTIAARAAISTVTQPKRFQFSMLQIMFAMAEIGALAALLKFLFQFGHPSASQIFATMAQGGILALFVLLAAWVAFGRRWPTVRVLSATALLKAITWGTDRAMGGHEDIFGMVLLLAFLLVSQLAVFRVCGYHFEFSRRRWAKSAKSEF